MVKHYYLLVKQSDKATDNVECCFYGIHTQNGACLKELLT